MNNNEFHKSNTITLMLVQATNYAVSRGFIPQAHTDVDDDNKPADFLQTLNKIHEAIEKRIQNNIFYASIYFNDDNNAFSIDCFYSHEQMLNEYSDNGNLEGDLDMASFSMPFIIKNEDGKELCKYFTLDIVMG